MQKNLEDILPVEIASLISAYENLDYNYQFSPVLSENLNKYSERAKLLSN